MTEQSAAWRSSERGGVVRIVFSPRRPRWWELRAGWMTVAVGAAAWLAAALSAARFVGTSSTAWLLAFVLLLWIAWGHS